MSKAAMRQKSRVSENVDDVLRNTGRKQNLFLENHICTIYRVTLLPNEHFSESKAMALVDKHYRKRQAHCEGRLLEDRLNLEKSKASGRAPFRPWVGYKEINNVYQSKSRPLFFVLCINSLASMKKYYEIYKCKTIDSTARTTEMIRRATNDPDKILRDPNAIRQVSLAPEDRVRSLPQFDVDERPPTAIIKSVSPIYDTRVATPSPVYMCEPSPRTISTVRENYVHAAPVSVPAPISIPKLSSQSVPVNGLEDVTYIAYDSYGQPYAAEKGPIYMFLSRKIAQYEGLQQKQGFQNYNSVYGSPLIYSRT